MNRRAYLRTCAAVSAGAAAGCLGFGDRVDSTLELTDADVDADAPPTIAAEGDAVTVTGTVEYGSSECGTVELAYADYERTQDRLDVLVVAADDRATGACSDDVARSGYRGTFSVNGRLRGVSATEHHVHGETYSATWTEN